MTVDELIAPSEIEAGTVFRAPRREDGAAISRLIGNCPPLDTNSTYAYLLLCEHFSQTCVVAVDESGEIDGFVSAYIPPQKPDVLFVWQVAVDERARGSRLAARMLHALMWRCAAKPIRYIETTVGPDNVASRKTFEAVALAAEAPIAETALFDAALLGDDAHEDERLLRIGPFDIDMLTPL